MSLPSSQGPLKWIWAGVLQSSALPHQRWYLWPVEHMVVLPSGLDVLLLPIQLPISPILEKTLFPQGEKTRWDSAPAHPLPFSFHHALAPTRSSLHHAASALSPLSDEYPRTCSLAEMHWGPPKVDPQKPFAPNISEQDSRKSIIK